MPNPSISSQLFGVSVFDLHLMSAVIENDRPYATTIPTFRPSSGKPQLITLPRTFYRGHETPYVRAAQDKQRHRNHAIMIATDPDHRWPLNAVLQALQGGFMTKTVSTRLADRDKLQAVNPAVYLHGTSSIGGALHFEHLIPVGDVQTFSVPIVRTDSTEQQIYHLADEARLVEWERIRKDRRPYSRAALLRENALTVLATNLRDDSRDAEAAAVAAFAEKKPSHREIIQWLDSKADEYKAKLTKAGFANVELRQALPGYEAVAPGTKWRQNIQGWNLPDYLAGLALLAFNYRVPVLGGHASVGCGFHPRRIYRVVVGRSGDQPTFDCLYKIEPFKPPAISMVDASGEWDEIIAGGEWITVTDKTKKLPGFVGAAIQAWWGCDKSKFDFDFIPRTVMSDDDE